jgi:hypothetical protein
MLVNAPDEKTPVVDLGSVMVTFIDPHRGYEVSFNRNYERFTFPVMVMMGPESYSGARFVATAEQKRSRVTGGRDLGADQGTLINVFWLEGDGTRQKAWSADNVKRLHALGMRNFNRDLIASFYARFLWSRARPDAGVPPQLALERRYPAMAMVVADPPAGTTAQALAASYSQRCAALLEGPGGPALCLAFTPFETRPDNRPDLAGDPANVPRLITGDELVLFWFFDADPAGSWAAALAAHDEILADSGGRTAWASCFIPVVPGTDTYMSDVLWLS